MAYTWDFLGNRKKGSFAQKKKELQEYDDLATSGYLDEISNSKRIRVDLDILDEEF